ncbi:hypothetical protein C7B79_35430, partial [Chroococcidiopsis cubana CCALA 043]
LQAAGIEVGLPSCFSEVKSVNEAEVVSKAQALEQNASPAKPVISHTTNVSESILTPPAPAADFSAKISQLVRQHTMPKPKQELPKPKDPVKQYLDWLRGDEPVLVEEARKKLTRLVMERDDLLAVWNEQGRLIDVEFSKLISNSASYEPK